MYVLLQFTGKYTCWELENSNFCLEQNWESCSIQFSLNTACGLASMVRISWEYLQLLFHFHSCTNLLDLRLWWLWITWCLQFAELSQKLPAGMEDHSLLWNGKNRLPIEWTHGKGYWVASRVHCTCFSFTPNLSFFYSQSKFIHKWINGLPLIKARRWFL